MDSIEHNVSFNFEKESGNTSKKKLIWITSLFIFICFAIMLSGAFFYLVQKENIRREKESELLSISHLKVKQIADYRKERYSEAEFLFNNETFTLEVKDLINNPKSEKAHNKVKDWLYSIFLSHSYEAIIVLNTSGEIIFALGDSKSSDRKDALANIDSCFSLQKIIVGDLEKTKEFNKIHLDIYVPLILNTESTEPKDIALVQLILNPENDLFEIMQSWPTKSKSGEVLVVRRDKDSVLFLNELRFRKNSTLNLRLPLSYTYLPAVKGILGERGITQGIDYRGEKVLAALNQVPGTNWIVVTKIDTKEVYDSLQSKGSFIVAIVIILLITLVLSFLNIWRSREMNFYKSRLSDAETIKKLNRIYQILSSVKQATIKSNNQEILFKEICNIIIADGNYSLCWIGVLDETDKSIKPMASAGFATSYIYGLKINPFENSPEGRSPTGTAFRNKIPVIVNDIQNDQIMEPWRSRAEEHNLKSSAAFPFCKDYNSYGTLNLYSSIKNYFSTEEIKLLEELAKDISFALNKFETERKRKEAEENLINNEKLLRSQNEQLALLNDKYLKINEELQDSNDKIQKINLELISAKIKAEESDHLKSAFLANMSHEIRTPMNAIMGFADLLKDGEVKPEKRKQYSEIILSRSNDLLHIIDDILDISKIESGTVNVNYSVVSVNKLLDELYIVYNQKIKQLKKNIELKYSKALPEAQASVSTDILKLKQIFTNLLDNAVKFTDEGKIAFGYQIAGKKVLQCYVSDTGIGIDPIYHEKIFERFKQAKVNKQKLYGGSGLGLSICKGNTKLLGGDIKVESELGKGSKFTFTVIYEHANKPIEIAIDKPIDKLLDFSGKKILIVEDDRDNVEFMKELLIEFNPELLIAKNGAEVRSYYNRLNELDLVLMDIQLPDINGYILTREIKTIRKDLPVIAQTAFVMENDREECLKAGCNDHIPKPIKCENLFSIINQYINKK